MVHPFNPYHGTKLYDVCLKEGFIPEGARGGDYRMDYILKQPQLTRKEVMGLYRTFALYVKFPKDRWDEIKQAEISNKIFRELAEEYRQKYLR